MIELLVVIGVIGILAAALMAVINPVEQMNRARDTRVQAALVDVVKGIERHSNMADEYPWQDDYEFNAFGPIDLVPGWVSLLETEEQITPGLANMVIDEIDSRSIQIWKPTDGLGAPIYLCFEPKSSFFESTSNNAGSICVPEQVELPNGGVPECDPGFVCMSNDECELLSGESEGVCSDGVCCRLL